MTSVQGNIPVLNTPVIDENGMLTPAWYGFFRSLFLRTGQAVGVSASDQSAQLDVAQMLGYASFSPAGSDLSPKLTEHDRLIYEAPNASGRIAELERRVALLETLLAAVHAPKIDLTQIQRDLDRAVALTMGHH